MAEPVVAPSVSLVAGNGSVVAVVARGSGASPVAAVGRVLMGCVVVDRSLAAVSSLVDVRSATFWAEVGGLAGADVEVSAEAKSGSSAVVESKGSAGPDEGEAGRHGSVGVRTGHGSAARSVEAEAAVVGPAQSSAKVRPA
jgi:hypothetical protein